MYYKNHVKRMRMNVYDLEKTDIILGMPWLQTHNSQINWETREVKMMRYLSICGRNIVVKEDKEQRKKIGKRIRAVDQVDRDEWKQTIKEKFNDEIQLDKEKVRNIVPQKFHKWLKVFEMIESERIPVKKPWNHTINLREDFVPRKGRTYLMSREEKEEIREFVKKQLKKGYI